MNHALDELHSKANGCKKTALICLALLVACYAVQFIWIAPEANLNDKSPQWVTLGYYSLILLLFAPGMYLGNARTFAWFCFMLMLYFCDSVITAFAVPHALGYLGIAESLLICMLFTAAMYAAKWYGLIANDGVSNRKKDKV